MARPKSENPLDQSVLVKMDKKLRIQLENYAKSNNTTLASTARKALIKFITEQIN